MQTLSQVPRNKKIQKIFFVFFHFYCFAHVAVHFVVGFCARCFSFLRLHEQISRSFFLVRGACACQFYGFSQKFGVQNKNCWKDMPTFFYLMFALFSCNKNLLVVCHDKKIDGYIKDWDASNKINLFGGFCNSTFVWGSLKKAPQKTLKKVPKRKQHALISSVYFKEFTFYLHFNVIMNQMS